MIRTKLMNKDLKYIKL